MHDENTIRKLEFLSPPMRTTNTRFVRSIDLSVGAKSDMWIIPGKECLNESFIEPNHPQFVLRVMRTSIRIEIIRIRMPQIEIHSRHS